jgi:hypothetical protein
MIEKTLEHIDKKRAALGLPVYDPSALAAAAIPACSSWKDLPLEERRAGDLYGVAATEGSNGQMSRYIATRAIRGANALVTEAE